jgi:hypothetical protein
MVLQLVECDDFFFKFPQTGMIALRASEEAISVVEDQFGAAALRGIQT